MRNIILFDDENRDQFLPLVYTKPVCELRSGILTIREKWEIYLSSKSSSITQDYLVGKYPISVSNDNYIINGALLPNPRIVKLILSLEMNEAILSEGELLAARLDYAQFDLLNNDKPIEEISGIELPKGNNYSKISQLSDLFKLNGRQIEADFDLLTKNRESEEISSSNTILGSHPRVRRKRGKYRMCCSELNGRSNLYWKRCDSHGRKYDSRTICNECKKCLENGFKSL